MRIIDYTKTYSDGHSIRYELNAANAPFVYINDQLDNPAQHFVETKGYESHIDKYYIEKFKGNPSQWKQKVVIYKEERLDSGISYGFTIKMIENNMGADIVYECEYAGRKSTHEGLVPDMDWQTYLFKEWKEKNQEIQHCV